MQSIPAEFEGSQALQFVISQGWNWKVGVLPNIEIETCPKCKKTGFGHFYMEIRGSSDEAKQRDSLFICQRCSFSGNLATLKQHLGIAIPSYISNQKEWASSERKVDKLPDVTTCHEALLADGDALDYLINVRGISKETIQTQKLGLVPSQFFRKAGTVRGLVFPYLVNDNAIWCHYRTLPDVNDLTKVPKDFSSPSGWDAQLYNGQIIKDGLEDLVMVEGEMDTLIALDRGITNIVGVPGANIKRAEWIDVLDKLDTKIYILYDKDRTGQRAAQTLASKIGIEKCFKIILPDFTIETESGPKKGKDLNEWFLNGGTLEQFEQLKQDAQLFDVDGVASSGDAVDEFLEELEGKGAASKYEWPFIKEFVRFDEGDVCDLIGAEKQGKSTVALNILEHMVENYGEDGVFVCLEMTRAKMARKWISHKTGIPDNLPQTTEEAAHLTEQFKEGIIAVKKMTANRPGGIYFCYPKYKSDDDIYKLIIDCVRRYGVKWVVIDNLQRLCDTTIGSKNRTQYLSEISKKTSQIAKDYNIQMIRIIQPHRIAEGKLVTSDSADGASQIGKDCDCHISINRGRIAEVTKADLTQGSFIHAEGTFSPEMLLDVGLSRYSGGGKTMVYFDGATSTVHTMAEGKIAAMNQKANAGVGYQNQIKEKNLPVNLPVQDEITI